MSAVGFTMALLSILLSCVPEDSREYIKECQIISCGDKVHVFFWQILQPAAMISMIVGWSLILSTAVDIGTVC